MTDQEVNKIIAEFMEEEFIEDNIFDEYNTNYTECLNSLVEVWHKLELFKIIINPTVISTRPHRVDVRFYACKSWNRGDKPTIQQAAAYATAKAILDLEDKHWSKVADEIIENTDRSKVVSLEELKKDLGLEDE